jgi:transaldolase
MKFFIDSADIAEIKEIASCKMLDGVTTNPTLIARSGGDFKKTIAKICALVAGPVSAEVAATNCAKMIEEGKILAKIAPNVCIKLPMTFEGIKACNYFSSQGIQTNMTLCFSETQAILAAKAGATFISPFVGRLDDEGADGIGLIETICTIYANYPDFKTQILTASVRNLNHIIMAAMAGAHVATIPGKIFKQLIFHPLTEKGLEIFEKDWANSGQKI